MTRQTLETALAALYMRECHQREVIEFYRHNAPEDRKQRAQQELEAFQSAIQEIEAALQGGDDK